MHVMLCTCTCFCLAAADSVRLVKAVSFLVRHRLVGANFPWLLIISTSLYALATQSALSQWWKISTVPVEKLCCTCYCKPDTITGRRTSVWEWLVALLIWPGICIKTNHFCGKGSSLLVGGRSKPLVNLLWQIDSASRSDVTGAGQVFCDTGFA